MLSHVPLSLLRSFEAAARSGSFRAAATELRLTPSAISHAVRKLEESLAASLFERSGRAVRLTPEGEALMRHIGRAFEELRVGLETVSNRGPRLLRVHSAPSFAAQWLMPRLPRFLAAHPAIEVRLAAGTDYTNFLGDEFDADIVYGQPQQHGLIVLPLGEEVVTPLCTPKIAAGIASPADLARAVLIESDNKRIRWADWFGANQMSAPPLRGVRFDRSFLAIAAAVDGLGVALESTLLAHREIERGSLVVPFGSRATDIRYVGHYLVCPRAVRQRRPLVLFAHWLGAELGTEFRLGEA